MVSRRQVAESRRQRKRAESREAGSRRHRAKAGSRRQKGERNPEGREESEEGDRRARGANAVGNWQIFGLMVDSL